MTSTATIAYDVPMSGWPPTSTLVHLDPPLSRFDVETGAKVEYPHVAIQVFTTVMGAQEDTVNVFASTEDGQFVHDTMAPIARPAYGVIHSVLKGMGYTVSN